MSNVLKKINLIFINNIYLQIVLIEHTHFCYVGLTAISFFLPVANSNVGQNGQLKTSRYCKNFSVGLLLHLCCLICKHLKSRTTGVVACIHKR